jgi:chromosome segregation ATPase
MRRDFLKQLGIEDKDIIDKILDENSADIGRAKGELDTYKTKVDNLEKEVKEKDSKIETLEKSAGDVTALNDKIKQLETANTNLTSEMNTKVAQIQKTHAIEGSIRDAKGKNIKAIMALLDMDKITHENGELNGLTEQLDALRGGEDSSFLFGEVQTPPPAGTHPKTPPTNGNNTPPVNSFSAAVAKALNKN